MAAQPVGGTITLLVNGTSYPARGSFTYSPTQTERTGFAGQDGHVGFTEKPKYGTIKGDISDFPGLSWQALQQAEIDQVQLNLRNGKVIVGTDGWVEGDIDVNTEDGKGSVSFGFSEVIEQTAAGA